MATMVKLSQNNSGVIDEAYYRINEAEQNRPLEFKSIVRIQAWFRAQRVRSYMRHLHLASTLIQKRWRGYLGRKHYRDILKQKVLIMKLNHYNCMATQIQKRWRAYYTRKYIFNYYSRRRYLEALAIKNEIVRSELEGYAEQQEMTEQIKAEKLQKIKQDDWSKKNHFLLSTEVIPGIYNSPYQHYPDIREFHLRNHKPKNEENQKSPKSIYDPSWKHYNVSPLSPLPPLHEKPQGPFRDPRKVQKQRYTPFQPTLKVATNFLSLDEAREKMKQEEWITRLNDDVFLPFSKRGQSYEPLLHSTSQYGHLPYGNQYFREQYADKFISPRTFQTVVPPIPILEKLNNTYSQGQV